MRRSRSPEAASGSPSLVKRLLALSDKAEQSGSYETAYHVLAAALHAADHAASPEQLEQVASHALDQERRLEAVRPPHPLAIASATHRGTQPLYRTLQVHIDAVRLRLAGQAQLERPKPRWPD